MDPVRVLLVAEGHDDPSGLAAALCPEPSTVSVQTVAAVHDASGRDDVDVVVIASHLCEADWVASRERDGVAVVAVLDGSDATQVGAAYAAGVSGHVDSAAQATILSAQASLLWTQLRHRCLAEDDATLDQLRENFLAHLSHELRTPLTAVYGTIEILAEELYGDIPAPLQECLEIALRNGAQLRRMIDDLLEATQSDRRSMTVELTCVATRPLLRDIIAGAQVAASSRGTRLFLDASDDLPATFADAARVRQVMANLIDNAVKFSPEWSDVHVSAADRGDGFVTISIRDSGPGIDPKIARVLFDPLRQSVDDLQSSRKGLGLGLYICKQLVETHGGRIWAEPGEGGGTVFSFTLPRFSLDHLVSALVDPLGEGAEPLNCIAVEVLPRNTDLGQLTVESVMDEAARIVRSAIRGDDLITVGVPELDHPALIAVLATCDDVGAAAIETRLRVRLASSRALQGLRLEPRVERATFAVRSGPTARQVAAVATDVGAFLRGRFGTPSAVSAP